MLHTNENNQSEAFDLLRLSNTQDPGEALRQGTIGAHAPFRTPFGSRRVVYADWTASGRALEQIESYVSRQVLPWYANTHTTSSVTGAQSTCLRTQARDTILTSVHGDKENDVVFFSGSGSTAAINKWVQLLNVEKRVKSAKRSFGAKPLVIVGPYEHHSNLLPWREAGAKVIQVCDSAQDGGPDLEQLESVLMKNKHRKLIVGSFSAASNVTGVLTNVEKAAKVLHKYGALACFDYACGAPYISMDMNPKDPTAAPDAIFISPHKFIGGVNTSGVLVCKRKAIVAQKPCAPHVGGGTVMWVSSNAHYYLADVVEREEGGTPDIVGNIRTGLVFSVKSIYGEKKLALREHELSDKIKGSLEEMPNVILLGPDAENNNVHRLPIMSFMIKHGNKGKVLHHAFVATLLNDIYGINARSGCMCAGPYANRLLGLTFSFLRETGPILESLPAMKPGFTRLSLAYFISDEEVDFILDAIKQLSEHAWKLLPFYRIDLKTCEWKCVAPEMLQGAAKDLAALAVNEYFEKSLQAAQELFTIAEGLVSKCSAVKAEESIKEHFSKWKVCKSLWFVVPEDILPAPRNDYEEPDADSPIVCPARYELGVTPVHIGPSVSRLQVKLWRVMLKRKGNDPSRFFMHSTVNM